MSAARSVNDALAQLERLRQAPARIAATVAPQFERFIRLGFLVGVDPYGAPWRPLAASTLARGRTPPPLTDSGATRESARVTAFGPNVVCTVDGNADFHQRTRPMLPDDARGLPDVWEAELRRAATEVEKGAA